MAFDFTAAIKEAAGVVERIENRGDNTTNYTYPLVYPQAGNTIVVRPLFNPKSGQIVRLINRHEKIACYRTYNEECPICKMQQQAKDLLGQDPFGRKGASKSRGICFAQYISSTLPIDKGQSRGNLQTGDLILFMFPWSVYSQINVIIQAAAQTPTGMDQAFSHAESGLYLQVSVTSDFKYTTTNVPYMRVPTTQTDDEFMKMLEGMEDLNEQVLPSTITDAVRKQVDEYSDAIYRQYIIPKTQSPVNSVPQNFSQSIPTPPPTVQYTTQTGQTVSTTASCIGNHQSGSPQCVCCPDELLCMEKSRG